MTKRKTNKNYTRLEKIEYFTKRIMKMKDRLNVLQNMTDEEHDQNWESSTEQDLALTKINKLYEMIIELKHNQEKKRL